MTALRFIRKKVKPFDAGFPQYYDVLQFHAGQHGWLEVPIVMEDSQTDSK